MKYYIIAGEASGDLHGSNLLKALKEADHSAEFRIVGGHLMEEQGGTLLKHYKDMAFMGLDVVLHLRTILRLMKYCQQDVLAWKPDVLILIDYPGFNLRIAKFAHSNGIRTYYYIAPKVWAWKENRVKQIRKFVDKLFIIFPFEKEYFAQHNIQSEYFGNPLNDNIHAFKNSEDGFNIIASQYGLEKGKYLALVAGSRRGEVKHLLPPMIKALEGLNQYKLVITAAPSIPLEFYQKIVGNKPIAIIYNQTYTLISNAAAAAVTSGTATLETALLKTPQVVVFKTNWPTYCVGKMLVKIKFFSLVNIIQGKEVVKELLQVNLERNIRNEISLILNDNNYKQNMLNNYEEIAQKLGEPGVAKRVANRIIELLK
ncbi:MAG TPA: lipid-A-disaccharide synthase [Bacteroidales bacterium]|nr:lipid-A-disaccharide synthase [Bacteroidales bacterium]